MSQWVINIILLSIAGLANATMDILKWHYKDSWFSKLGSKVKWFERWAGPGSWQNKYKDRTPSLGPAFLGSTTLLVFTTDAWHFFQMVWRVSFTLAVSPAGYVNIPFVPEMLSDFIVNSGIYLIVFNLFYEKILRR